MLALINTVNGHWTAAILCGSELPTPSFRLSERVHEHDPLSFWQLGSKCARTPHLLLLLLSIVSVLPTERKLCMHADFSTLYRVRQKKLPKFEVL